MPKRGHRLPWRVTYEWENGIKGTSAHYSEDEACLQAEKIRRASLRRELRVSVSVAQR